MEEHVRKITEKTLIPLSLVVTAISLAVWLTTIRNDINQSEQDVQRLERMQQDHQQSDSKIDERLSRIEGMLRAHWTDRGK